MTDLKKLAERVVSLERRIAELEAWHVDSVSQRAATGTRKKLSVKEFIIAKKPSNDVEKTLAIGYYLERYTDATTFNVDDLARYYQLAKEATPQNINDKVNLNIKKGHMAESREKKDKKKAWVLTNSGEKFVESGFKDKN